MVFQNRRTAGQKLAERLVNYEGRADVVVLGLARGGLPVADEVARKLKVPLDVFLVRKLGVPGREELALGAIASGGVRVMNQDIVTSLRVSQRQIEDVAEREKSELERREKKYRGDRDRIELAGKVVILVDDGLATGASMRAAVDAVKSHHPEKVIIAVPTAPPDTCSALKRRVDEMICLETPSPFYGVGAWYESFPQVNDKEVTQILEGFPLEREDWKDNVG